MDLEGSMFEEREHYREEWRLNVASLDEDIRTSDQAAIGFAHLGLKSALMLNGGALVALPAFTALFSIDVVDSENGLVVAIIFFVLGLIAGWYLHC